MTVSEANDQPDRTESAPDNRLARLLKRAAREAKGDPALRRWLERLAAGEEEGEKNPPTALL